MKIIVWN